MADNPLGRVFSGSININTKGGDVSKMRQLGWYQLVLVLKGKGYYRDRLGGAFPLSRGDLVITPPGLHHQLGPAKDSVWSDLVIMFNGSIFDSLHQSGQLTCHDHPIALSPVDLWYRKFYRLMQLNPGESTQPIGYLGRFLGVLGTIPFAKQEIDAEGGPVWIKEALDLIEAAPQSSPLNVMQVARKCNLGYDSFRRYFANFIGHGPSEYHKNLRIRSASEMIAYGNKSFKQIAAQLGYFDSFHFSKHFKEKTGLSPRQFKAELVKRNIKEVNGDRVEKLSLQEWFKVEEDKRRLKEKTAAERRRNWRLILKEGFEEPNSLAKWHIHGEWTCSNGELCVRGKEGLVVTLKTPVPGDVRLVFDCHLESDFLSDVSCFFCALNPSEETSAYTRGYYFQYGAFQNRRIILSSSDGNLWNQPAAPLVRGKIYHVDAQKIGNRLILSVDEKTIIDVQDHHSAFGAEHAFLGLCSWGTVACFSNVHVYSRDSALQADLLDTAEDFLARGDYNTAKGLFQEVIQSSQSVQRTEMAKQGLSKTLNRIKLNAEFPAIERRLSKVWPKAILKLDPRGIIVNIRALGIENLAPLQGLPVSELYCDNNRITSLQPLNGMDNLRKLSCYKNQIYSLDPLQGVKLVSLECSDNQITHLDPLRGMDLKSLVCVKNQISNIEPLRGMKLDALLCACNNIENLDPLRGMALLRLSFPNNRVSSLVPLQGMSLDFLNCSWNQIKDLEPLRGMRLSQLRCNGNHITGLDPLQGMPLCSLNCAWNQIDNLSPLADMTLKVLSCHDNPINSIKPLLKRLPDGLYVGTEHFSADEQEYIHAQARITPKLTEVLRHAKILSDLKRKNYDKVAALARRFGNHRYLIIPRESTWQEAIKICKELGGHLAIIRNQKENDFLRAQVGEGTYNWIGLFSDQKKMAWVTGEPCRYQKIDLKTFVSGHSCLLSSSELWSGNSPWLEDDGFCVEWDL